jgi:AcrR family transcriptional regulator
MTVKGNDSRQRIMDAVTQLFIDKGYHGTGVQEISKAANMGRGALYHHIGSKEQVLFDISISLLEDATNATLPFATTDDPPETKFRNVARALLDHHATHGAGWIVAVQESRFLSAEHRQEVAAERRKFEALWTQILTEGADKGAWRAVDAIDVRAILGMFNYAGRWVKVGGRLTPEEIADRFVDLLLDGLKS